MPIVSGSRGSGLAGAGVAEGAGELVAARVGLDDGPAVVSDDMVVSGIAGRGSLRSWARDLSKAGCGRDHSRGRGCDSRGRRKIGAFAWTSRLRPARGRRRVIPLDTTQINSRAHRPQTFAKYLPYEHMFDTTTRPRQIPSSWRELQFLDGYDDGHARASKTTEDLRPCSHLVGALAETSTSGPKPPRDRYQSRYPGPSGP